MKIYSTTGKLLKERPDYSKGRLLQDEKDPEKYIFSPWDEVPAREEETAPSKEPTIADQITDMQMALADLYEEKNNNG